MSDDPDEIRLKQTEERMNPARVGDLLESIEWRLMYGEYKGLGSIKIALWIIVILLAVIAYRLF